MVMAIASFPLLTGQGAMTVDFLTQRTKQQCNNLDLFFAGLLALIAVQKALLSGLPAVIS